MRKFAHNCGSFEKEIPMESNLLKWSAAIGAFPRILHYQKELKGVDRYFDRLRIVNDALGPHWIFRLADAVGLDKIKENRPSWHAFYVDDIDRLHCPLDPGAPETEAYLGREYSAMDMAFYAGMGFDGYRLALETKRKVDFDSKELELDGRYRFVPSAELKASLDEYDNKRFIPKQDYYAAYADALKSVFDSIESIVSVGHGDEQSIEWTAAASLVLLCGGHHGCRAHISHEEEFRAQMGSLIIFSHARNIVIGKAGLNHSKMQSVRIAA